MKRVLIISLNSGGTMGHGKIISSLANYLSKKNKKIILISDMPFSNNFDLDKKVKVKNIEMMPHINYTIGGMCNCIQKNGIYKYAKKNKIDCVIFSTFFDLNLVKKFKNNGIKTMLLSYPIRDTYRLALKQAGTYTIFDKVITLYGPEFNDKVMPNEILVNPLKIVSNEIASKEKNDILITCGGGGRPSSKIFFSKIFVSLKKVILKHKGIKIRVIKGNSKISIDPKNIKIIIWTKDFGSIISSSNIIISEAGYFTMLDLINYKKKAILIPGERIIDNQELRALKLEKLGIAKVFFPFEKPTKLSDLVENLMENEKSYSKIFEQVSNEFKRYPDLGKSVLGELK